MPPKRTAAAKRAAAKPAPKRAAAKKAAAKKAAASPVEPAVAVSVLPDEPPQKRRQILRRHTDEQVDRAISTRLSHVPPSVLEGKTDSKGTSIREYIGRAIKDSTQGRLGSRFWCKLNDDFGLCDSLADGLADPPDGEEPDAELIEMLQLCHHENPAARRTTALERYLEHCKVINKTSLYGLLRSTQESPSLTKVNCQRCQVAILKYFVRIGKELSNHKGS